MDVSSFPATNGVCMGTVISLSPLGKGEPRFRFSCGNGTCCDDVSSCQGAADGQLNRRVRGEQTAAAENMDNPTCPPSGEL